MDIDEEDILMKKKFDEQDENIDEDLRRMERMMAELDQ